MTIMRRILLAAIVGAAVGTDVSRAAVRDPESCSGTDYDYFQLVTQWDITQCMVCCLVSALAPHAARHLHGTAVHTCCWVPSWC
jgi:hypothetical protein